MSGRVALWTVCALLLLALQGAALRWGEQDALPAAHRTRRRAFIFNGFGARISLGPFQIGFGAGPDEAQSVDEIAKEAPVANVAVPPPQLRVAPPGGVMPPAGGLLPPGGLMTPGGGMMPPGGLMPPGGGMLPPGGLMTPGGGMMPPGGGLMPPGGLMPSPGVMMSPGGGMLPPGGLMPSPGVMMSPGGGMMPTGSSERPEPRYSGPLPDVGSIMSKLAASLTLHDNLVTVFGFLLTRADASLGLELYVSLQQLLEATKQRAVRTVELLRLLPDMALEDPHRQLVRLFFELPKTCPRYLIGAIKTWQEALTNNKTNMIELMSAGRNVSLLQKIEPGLVPETSSSTAFSEISSRLAPAEVTYRMGKFFGNIMGEIINNSLQVTLPLVGYLLMHLRLPVYSPEVEEARQYLKDVLVENRSEHRVAVSSLSPSDKQDEYALVGAVLRALPSGDVFLMESAHAVLPHLHAPDYNTHNPYLTVMAPVVGGDTIRYDLLFKLVTAGEFPDDIVMCKDRLMMSISVGKLDMDTVLEGFVRYEYKKPLDLLVAVLQRIRRRARLQDDLLDVVLALDVHVKMKRAAVEMDDDKIRGTDDLTTYFDAFRSPFLSDEVRRSARMLADILKTEPIDWSTWLARFPRSEYSRPRQLVISLLEALVQGGEVKSEKLGEAVHDFQEAVKPAPCPKVTCPPKSNKKEKVDAIPMQQLLDVFHILLPEDEQQLTILKSLLLNPISLATALGDDFPLHQYETKGVLMQAILGVCLRSELVRQSPELKAAIQYFLPRVRLDGPGAERVSPLFVTSRTIDMNKVLLALTSGPLDDEQQAKFERVVTFLEEAFYQPQFSGGFHVTNFKTRADFITGLFNHLLSLEATPPDIKEALRDLLPLVETKGLGALPVDYIENEPASGMDEEETSSLSVGEEELSVS